MESRTLKTFMGELLLRLELQPATRCGSTAGPPSAEMVVGGSTRADGVFCWEEVVGGEESGGAGTGGAPPVAAPDSEAGSG